jgi:hypothetical protein
MAKRAVLLRALSIPMLAGCLVFPAATGALAQNSNAPRKPRVVNPSDADAAAARDAHVVFMKAFSGTRPRTVPEAKLTIRNASAGKQAASKDRGDGDNLFVRVPGHLSFNGDLFQNGGAVVESAESHDIYLAVPGCATPSCYGDPETFLRDLGKSEFIHITDQYVHETASNRYTLGESAVVPLINPPKQLSDTDVQTFVHGVAAKSGETGYGHIYHVFIPPGQDECISIAAQICASNIFCAYHSSVDFPDIGHVLYSVEPFADVPGCQVAPGTPNGTLVDTTNDVLSHELIETITDPDGTAWFDITSGGMFGEEIGDECVFVVFIGQNAFSDPVVFDVDGRKYAIQPEYNNRAQACTAER